MRPVQRPGRHPLLRLAAALPASAQESVPWAEPAPLPVEEAIDYHRTYQGALQANVDLGHSRPHFVEIDAGADHAYGRTANGRVLCWGSSFWGQLGDGTVSRVDLAAGGSAFGSFTCVL